MKHWADNIKENKCSHEVRGLSVVKDFTYADTGKHLYCPMCKCHWYKDRFWTREEWNDYVNEV